VLHNRRTARRTTSVVSMGTAAPSGRTRSHTEAAPPHNSVDYAVRRVSSGMRCTTLSTHSARCSISGIFLGVKTFHRRFLSATPIQLQLSTNYYSHRRHGAIASNGWTVFRPLER
jgi:hypothetical protein